MRGYIQMIYDLYLIFLLYRLPQQVQEGRGDDGEYCDVWIKLRRRGVQCGLSKCMMVVGAASLVYVLKRFAQEFV
jgi:hypothetical protein